MFHTQVKPVSQLLSEELNTSQLKKLLKLIIFQDPFQLPLTVKLILLNLETKHIFLQLSFLRYTKLFLPIKSLLQLNQFQESSLKLMIHTLFPFRAQKLSQSQRIMLLIFQLEKSLIKRILKIQLLQNNKVKFQFSKSEIILTFHCTLYQKYMLQFSKINQLPQLKKMQTIM